MNALFVDDSKEVLEYLEMFQVRRILYRKETWRRRNEVKLAVLEAFDVQRLFQDEEYDGILAYLSKSDPLQTLTMDRVLFTDSISLGAVTFISSINCARKLS